MTAPQRRVLARIAQGEDVPGVLPHSAFGGGDLRALRALLATGLVEMDGPTGSSVGAATAAVSYTITDAGREALAT